MTRNFFEAIVSIFIFLPHFFCVPFLLKTLFAPWKNLTSTNKSAGFTFSDFFDRVGFNLVSRFMGALMRGALLVAYLLTMGAYILLLPFIIVLYFLSYPIVILAGRMSQSPHDKRQEMKASFVKSHAQTAETRPIVEQWFDNYYQQVYARPPWWKLSSLLAIPPLGRDWTAGYTPTLDQFTTDLALTHSDRGSSHMVDREKEVSQITRALLAQDGGNALLVGEEGVGKHTIILSLAHYMYEGKVPPALSHKRVLSLEMEKILSSHEDQKMRETTLENLFQEASDAANIILVIDNFDKYVVTSKDRVDITISLEKYTSSPQLHFIGVTTPKAYEQYVARNDKIVRHFEKVLVYEVTVSQAEQILLDYVPKLEGRYRLIIPYESIRAAIAKSESFVTQIPYPEKVMKILDEACVLAQTKQMKVVDPSLIDEVIGETAHVATTLTPRLRSKLLTLEAIIGRRVLQQEAAIKRLATALSSAFVSLGSRKKPLATLLFLGPTGVGKTETAKALAALLFEAEDAIVRFDMSLYQTQADIAKLVGGISEAQPGLLTMALREKPYTVLLLDEVEKAHPDLLNIFLTVLDEGYFTDSQGKRVNARNTIVIATSNAGESAFAPEFLNRFDAVVPYRPLGPEDMQPIAQQMVGEIVGKIYAQHKITVKVAPELIAKVIKEQYDPHLGARNLAHLLRERIEGTVAPRILKQEVSEGATIEL